MKHLLSLTITMLISMGCHAETITGKCYEGGVNWQYDTETGTLTFTPDENAYRHLSFKRDENRIPYYYFLDEGEEREYYSYIVPGQEPVLREDVLPEWYNFKNNIKCVVIEDGIGTIDRCAFKLCKNLEEVYLPAFIHGIWNQAFYGCSKLKIVHTRTMNTPTLLLAGVWDYDRKHCSDNAFQGVDLQNVTLMVAKEMKKRVENDSFYNKFGNIVEEDADAVGNKDEILFFHPSFVWNKYVDSDYFEESSPVIPTNEAFRAFCDKQGISYENYGTKTVIAYEWTLFAKDKENLLSDCDRRYECLDGNLYLLDEIPEDFWRFITAENVELNLEEPYRDKQGSNPVITKNISEESFQYISCDESWGVPDNRYIKAYPSTEAVNPQVGYELGILLPDTKYEVTIVMAPNTEDVDDQRPNYFRIYHTKTLSEENKYGQWDTKDMTMVKLQDGSTFYTTGQGKCDETKFNIETDEVVRRHMILLQSYVTGNKTSVYDRTLRIASITVKHIHDNNETRIDDNSELHIPNYENDGVMYNLSGQMVSNDYKGIVIINGKKVLK